MSILLLIVAYQKMGQPRCYIHTYYVCVHRVTSARKGPRVVILIPIHIYIYIYMYVCIGPLSQRATRGEKNSEAVLGVWLPAPLPTSRAPPDRGALQQLA